MIKTKYGYHILQVEEKQTAHTKPLDEVKPTIVALLTRQKEAQQEQAFAQQLASEAQKNGLAKTAEAHHLQVVTTDYLQQSGIVPGLADSSKFLSGHSPRSRADRPSRAHRRRVRDLQVAEVKAAHAPSFDEYKSHVLEDYRQQQLPHCWRARPTSWRKGPRGNDLAKAAKEVGATMKTSDLVRLESRFRTSGSFLRAPASLFDLKRRPDQLGHQYRA